MGRKINDMKRLILIFIMCVSLFAILAHRQQPYRSVDVEEFAKIITDKEVVLLDVRTADEYAEGHIPGAMLNIDVLSEDFASIAERNLDKDKTIALYCRSGNRSKTAAHRLTELGYNVVELGSGIKGWTGSGREIEK